MKILRWVTRILVVSIIQNALMTRGAYAQSTDIVSTAVSLAALHAQANDNLVEESVEELQSIIRQPGFKKTKHKKRKVRVSEGPTVQACGADGAIVVHKSLTGSIFANRTGQFEMQSEAVYSNCYGINGTIGFTAVGTFNRKSISRTISASTSLYDSVNATGIQYDFAQERSAMNSSDDFMTGTYYYSNGYQYVSCVWNRVSSVALQSLVKGCK